MVNIQRVLKAYHGTAVPNTICGNFVVNSAIRAIDCPTPILAGLGQPDSVPISFYLEKAILQW
jgi:hypothetical protein